MGKCCSGTAKRGNAVSILAGMHGNIGNHYSAVGYNSELSRHVDLQCNEGSSTAVIHRRYMQHTHLMVPSLPKSLDINCQNALLFKIQR